MASIYGNNIQVSIFGQSHSAGIGVVVDGLPVGEAVDLEALQAFMNRRAPGQNAYSTKRKEADAPEVLSGLVAGHTCGAPFCAVIRNTNTRSGDYANLKEVPRPAHADYAAQVKYGGNQDVAGGGHFSGRLTAPLCIAGGICKQILSRKGIEVRAHIVQIGSVKASKANACDITPMREFVAGEFPAYDEGIAQQMQEEIEAARLGADSVGGMIECVITGVPAGIGDPMFDGMENRLASMLFGIPAVKGVEFGNGFEVAGLRGSENNDPFCVKDGVIATETNNHGGILGGITSGMPIVFRVALKPTPSIGKEQKSVRMATLEEETLVIQGRHDPCIVPRAVPVVEAAAAVVLLDFLA